MSHAQPFAVWSPDTIITVSTTAHAVVVQLRVCALQAYKSPFAFF
jgi:hypothetical protein